jgi:hypothetical protein
MLNKAREQLGGDSFSIPKHLRYALPTNGGTIDYVARRAGVRGSAEMILKRLVETYKRGGALQEAAVPSLVFTGIQEMPDGRRVKLEKVGFAAAIAGIGTNFFEKYYQARIPGPKTIVEVVSKAAVSLLVDEIPIVRTSVPQEWLAYGREIMAGLPARVIADGKVLPMEVYTQLAVGAFKINLGGVMKMFPRAGKGFMHVSCGDPDHWDTMANLPRMVSGRQLNSTALHDGPSRELIVEATTDRLLRPNIDGEFFDNVRTLTVRPGPRFKVPRIDAKSKI